MDKSTAAHLAQCQKEAGMLKSESIKTRDAINPEYYKDVLPDLVPGLEFMNLMEHLHSYEEMSGACRIMAFKYMIRSGEKDPAPQEYRKAAWYLNYLADMTERAIMDEYPIRVDD